jgi:superfamily I DNA/RNA helicase
VLALTFTSAAARELRTRLRGVLGPDGLGVEATTFHAWVRFVPSKPAA